MPHSRLGLEFGNSGGGIPGKRGCSAGRYCTEGKRTFSSRLILEKHIQVRHGIKVTDPARSQEVVIARGPPGPAQVGLSPVPAFPGNFGGLGQDWGGFILEFLLGRRKSQP